MTLHEPGALPGGLVDEHVRLPGIPGPFVEFPALLRGYVRKTLAIVALEAQKLRHDPTELLTRAVQPALWLVVFGETMTTLGLMKTGYSSYLDFLAPGILAQSVLFVAIFYGIAAIWERDLGIIHKFMVTPTPRTALVLGKALAAGVRALSQVLVIYALAFALGVHVNLNPLALLGVIVIVFLGAALFATFSLIIAALVRTRERFMGIGQLLTMPLFFASSAIYPINIIPTWLQPVASVNPLTYMVDACRILMVTPGIGNYSLGMDFGVLIGFNVVLILLGGRAYRRLVT
ncbi:MAG TPA: ABC transporter permease [Thermoplasmata archaeon]|nr:ABC transporter permease [Thermoplasmata archaeon]